jgi:hypothetical protein
MTYSISLMWINSGQSNFLVNFFSNNFFSNAFKQYICDDVTKKLFEPALSWAETNREAQIIIWYDGAHVSKQAVINTQCKLDVFLKHHNVNNIILQDVRTINMVANNPDVFSSQIPIYFRVDLLKLMIILHRIEKGDDFTIFTDLEVKNNFIPKHVSLQYNQAIKQSFPILLYKPNGDCVLLISHEKEYLLTSADVEKHFSATKKYVTNLKTAAEKEAIAIPYELTQKWLAGKWGTDYHINRETLMNPQCLGLSPGFICNLSRETHKENQFLILYKSSPEKELRHLQLTVNSALTEAVYALNITDDTERNIRIASLSGRVFDLMMTDCPFHQTIRLNVRYGNTHPVAPDEVAAWKRVPPSNGRSYSCTCLSLDGVSVPSVERAVFSC